MVFPPPSGRGKHGKIMRVFKWFYYILRVSSQFGHFLFPPEPGRQPQNGQIDFPACAARYLQRLVLTAPRGNIHQKSAPCGALKKPILPVFSRQKRGETAGCIAFRCTKRFSVRRACPMQYPCAGTAKARIPRSGRPTHSPPPAPPRPARRRAGARRRRKNRA